MKMDEVRHSIKRDSMVDNGEVKECSSRREYPYIQPFDAIRAFPFEGETSIRTLRMSQKNWCFKVGRVAYDRGVGRYEAEEFVKNECGRFDIQGEEFADLAEEFDCGWNYSAAGGGVPGDAPEQCGELVNFIDEVVGHEMPPAPGWCWGAPVPYRRLYVGALILGYGGRQFMFASGTMASAMSVPSQKTVQRFLKAAQANQFMECVVKGKPFAWSRGKEKGGVASRYVLGEADKYRLAHLFADQKQNDILLARLTEEDKFRWILDIQDQGAN